MRFGATRTYGTASVSASTLTVISSRVPMPAIPRLNPSRTSTSFFAWGKDDSHWRQKQPSDVLEAFETCLANRYGSTNVAPGRRCVTVTFDKRNPTVDEEGKVLSNDAVPAYDTGECYEIPDRDVGRWIKTDPNVHRELATAKNKAIGGAWVPLVKMLKRWNRSAEGPIKPSFLIEVMALDLTDPPFTTYPAEVRRFFASALDGVLREWPDPAGLGSPVSDQMTWQRQEAAVGMLRRAEMSAARAVRLEQQGKNGEALTLWREVMGSYFPLN